jgi:heme-degrading monooxygenase HmoA
MDDDLRVLEHAVLTVVPGREDEYERALRAALPIIRSVPGCLSAQVSRCVEAPNRYLLLVEWERLEDHDPGFRGSADYQRWKALLHHFYDPFPVVDHYVALEPGPGVTR